jgi:copper/silver efflux system protein
VWRARVPEPAPRISRHLLLSVLIVQPFAVVVYARDFREDLPALGRVLIRTPGAAQIPLGQVVTVALEPGPAMIRDEDGLLAGYIYVDTDTRDIGGFVRQAQEAVGAGVSLPPGYTLQWTGQYEFQVRARERLQVILPIVLFVIFVLLQTVFRSFAEAAIVALRSPKGGSAAR